MSPSQSRTEAVPFRDVWTHPGRTTRAVVDLDAVEGNVAAVRRHVGSAVDVMAVVKANAYGHGARAIAEAAVRAGATWLGVATVEEGGHLRAAGLITPILVLGPVDDAELPLAAARQLTVAFGDLEAISAAARARVGSTPLDVHLKVDSGMRRFGVRPHDAASAARLIAAAPSLRLRGVFTHFARADETDPAPSAQQMSRFESALDAIRAIGIDPGLIHACNTAALVQFPRWHGGMVRLGIGLYGLRPSAEVALLPGMRPALTLLSRVRHLLPLHTGDGVSYGATYRADRDRIAALVPIGYADGYPRQLSNRGWMTIGGRSAPVLGRVCMDQTVVGIGCGETVALDAEVVVAGPHPSGDGPALDDLADWCGTINYEIATSLATRVPRLFLRDGRVVAIQSLAGYQELGT